MRGKLYYIKWLILIVVVTVSSCYRASHWYDEMEDHLG